MPFDPSNVCARTAAGDAELARPSKGLALAQRKLLSALDAPLILDELATRYGVENARLIRDLEHLAAVGLVVVHGAGRSTSGSAARRTPAPVPVPVPAPVPADVPAGMSARVAPRKRPSRSRRVVMLLLIAAIMATGIVLLGRSGAVPSVMGDESPPSAAPRAAVVPAPPPEAPPPPAPARGTEPAPVLAGDPPPAAAVPVDPGPSAAARPAAAAPVVVPAASAAAPGPPALATPLPAVTEPAPPPQDVASEVAPAEAPRPVSAPLPAPAVTSAAPERPTPPMVAAASPSSPPAERPATRPLVPVTQDAPPFPREAINAGTRQGTVRARLTLDAAGRVTNVAIVEAQPRRVFDRAVTTALAYWTYEPGAPGRTTEVEVAFRRD